MESNRSSLSPITAVLFFQSTLQKYESRLCENTNTFLWLPALTLSPDKILSSTKLGSSWTVPSVGLDFWASVLPSHWLLARAPLSQFSQNPPPSIWDGAPHPHHPRVMSDHTGLPSAGIQLGRFSQDLPFSMMFLPWSSIHGPPPAPWLEIPTCPGCIQSGAPSLSSTAKPAWPISDKCHEKYFVL